MIDDTMLKHLFELNFNPLMSKFILNALKLQVFDDLIEPTTATQLAEKRGWHAPNTEMFLQALYSLSFLTKEGEAYCNVDEGNQYLVTTSDAYAGAFVLFFGEDMAGSFPADFTELLTQGPPSAEEMAASQKMNMDFTALEAVMRSVQTGYSFKQIKEMISELEEFDQAKKILDLGCGVGMYGLGLASFNKDTEVVLFDLPPMQSAIERSIEMTDMAEQTKVLVGDFTTDDIGSGYDLIISLSSIYAAKGCIDDFMKKIHRALNPGGIFFCASDGIERDHSGPWDMILAWLPYRMQGANMEVEKDLVKNAGIQAGLVSVKKETRQMLGGHFDIDILKKN